MFRGILGLILMAVSSSLLAKEVYPVVNPPVPPSKLQPIPKEPTLAEPAAEELEPKASEELQMPREPVRRLLYTFRVHAWLEPDGHIQFDRDWKLPDDKGIEPLDHDMFKSLGDWVGSYGGGSIDDEALVELNKQKLELTTLRWWTARKAAELDLKKTRKPFEGPLRKLKDRKHRKPLEPASS
jgi:hypothetical protein